MKTTFDINRDRRDGLLGYGWNLDRDVQFDHFLDCIVPSEEPRLYFEHVVVPHFPWCYLPSGRKYAVDNGSELKPYGVSRTHPWETWDDDELTATHGYQRYLLQVGYTDYLVGRLVERLKTAGLYDRCLLVITADHGVSFRSRFSRRSPRSESLPDILSIPLFVKRPEQHEGAVSDRNVETIDVLPTILDAIGVEPPLPTDGQSVLNDSIPERPRKVFDNEGVRLTIDAAFDSKYDTLKRLLDKFGSGANPDGLYKIGPYAELIGRRVADLTVNDPADFEIEMTRTADRLRGVPTQLAPCFFEGRVRANANTKLPIHLAIAVDGTILAVTRTYLAQDIKNVWTALAPEDAFDSGQANVQIFAVSGTGPEVKLQPVRTR